MRLIDSIAITGTVLGIGGIAGAIEHGTSPVAAVVCLVVGVACMKWSYKRSEDKMERKSDFKKQVNKIQVFLTALQDCYRSEENRVGMSLPKLELSNGEITDDFLAIIQAFYLFYKGLTEDETADILEFTHIINRIVVQDLIADSEED